MPTLISHQYLLAWFDSHKREMPWRLTKDPYAIWVSEVMLQQTQVATVRDYFLRWMQRFPSVDALAVADEQDVLSIWQGLGYYRRCRMLLAGARWVASNGLPQTAAEWRNVPGVGRYTAGAIASIAMGEPTPVVDGNVERVFARLTGCSECGPRLNRDAWLWAEKLVPEDRPGDWNQALMELGATVCKPKDPSCQACPLRGSCIAASRQLQHALPVRAEKPTIVRLESAAYVIVRDGMFGLEQIPAGEWWEGMWRFPSEAHAADLCSLGTVRHAVTRHRIAMRVWLLRGDRQPQNLSWFAPEDLASLPMPAPQRRALDLAQRFFEGQQVLF